jgi:hypothetical protein
MIGALHAVAPVRNSNGVKTGKGRNIQKYVAAGKQFRQESNIAEFLQKLMPWGLGLESGWLL